MSNDIFFHLGSGEIVFDRKKSHIHKDTIPYLNIALKKISSFNRKYITEVIDLKKDIGFNECVETSYDDEIFYARRKGRKTYTRYVKNREPIACQTIVISLIKNSSNKEKYHIITAYIGQQNISGNWLKHEDLLQKYTLLHKQAMYTFWRNHALVYKEEDIQIETLLSEKDFFNKRYPKKLKNIEIKKIDNKEYFIEKFKSGEKVIDDIKSNIDDSAYPYLEEAIKKIDSEKQNYFEKTIDLERNIGKVNKNLTSLIKISFKKYGRKYLIVRAELTKIP